MSTVSAYEAKTHLSALLDRAEAGEEVTITKHGRPVARLLPATPRVGLDSIAAQMRSFRESVGGEPIDVRSLIEEGRRH
jgi:prevent-host-death family protein